MRHDYSVLHLSTARPESGAGGAAFATHLSLLEQGIASRMLFLTGVENEKLGLYSLADSPVRKFKRLLNSSIERAYLLPYRERQALFSPGMTGQAIRNHPLVKAADILHLNWINYGFVDPAELREIGKPIVWTMHDMWAFTGGCHYAMGCRRFLSSCGACPVLGSTDEDDLSTRVQRRKLRTFPAPGDVAWVGVSSWLSREARSSTVLQGHDVATIHSGIDTRTFRPQDRRRSREALGLPLDATIVLLGAHDIHSPFKGVQYSIDALRALSSEHVVVTFGHGTLPPGTIPQRVVHAGFIRDAHRMSQLYSAADVFLATSVAEAFGKTLAEAQCCGTPVVAFGATGPSDIVEHLETGYLAADRNAADVAEGIRYCLAKGFSPSSISERAQRLSIDRCTRQYMELYTRLLDERQTS
jgi:glycosyltransferase involved in cell wall biosynthesis